MGAIFRSNIMGRFLYQVAVLASAVVVAHVVLDQYRAHQARIIKQ